MRRSGAAYIYLSLDRQKKLELPLRTVNVYLSLGWGGLSGGVIMSDTRETILAVARARAQAHGYNGLNFRDLATDVGIKSASIHYHFPTKADLGIAVARRYWEDSSTALEALWAEYQDPIICLREYPLVFRKALENDNRMCMCGFMAAEYDDLPQAVKTEVKTFADVHVAWLTKVLSAADPGAGTDVVKQRAGAIFAAIGGAQLMARSRADVSVFDAIVEGYRGTGLIPV
jgi:TetR/AcrR family transcriptional regulator, transcriptional repressor for nem operon